MPGRWAEYRDASFGSRILSERLIAAAKAQVGEKVLDEFDGFAVIWAGNSVRRTSALWPMRLNLKQFPNKAAFKMSEFHLGEMAAIGVACHEMGHTFGVNDKYGLGATPNPLGPWCLMAKGTHGAEPSGRHRPFHMCAWCKSVIGWVTPSVIDPRQAQKLALRPISFGPAESYRILLKPDGSEYLLLENRRREGFHTDLPSAGLVILRVGPNDRPNSPQTRVQLLPAHGLPPLSRGVVAKPEAVAWPQPGRTELTIEKTRISNIRLVDDVVYFEVGAGRQSIADLRQLEEERAGRLRIDHLTGDVRLIRLTRHAGNHVLVDRFASDQVLLDDLLQHLWRTTAIPTSFGHHDRDRPGLADAQTEGLGPQDAPSLGQVELLQPLLKVTPRLL